MCQTSKCKLVGKYGNLGEYYGTYCHKHKKDGMIRIRLKYCRCCTKRAIFGYESNKVLMCKDHKHDDMTNVTHKMCVDPECDLRANYNYKGLRDAIYCNEHKKDGMINIISKRCLDPTCNKVPNYNYKGKLNGLYCLDHKKEGMVDVRHQMCIASDCNKLANSNYDGEPKAIYCCEHKLANMVNVISKRCLNELCDTLVSNKYKGYCFRCFIYKFPESPLTKNYKTKELYVTNKIQQWINMYYPDSILVFDRKISGGCSLKRPDIFIDLLTHVIIIEVDENQHRYTSCENKRLVQLYEDVAHRPCVFLRFNPDSYKDIDGKRQKGCFKYTQTGLCVIDSEKRMDERLEPVYKSLRTHLTTPLEKSIHVEQFWYDNYQSQ